MNKKEREQAEKLLATYEKLAARPWWKDALLWLFFSAIMLLAIDYFSIGEEQYFLTPPYYLKLAIKVLVMAALMVLLTRWINQRGLKSLKRRLGE